MLVIATRPRNSRRSQTRRRSHAFCKNWRRWSPKWSATRSLSPSPAQEMNSYNGVIARLVSADVLFASKNSRGEVIARSPRLRGDGGVLDGRRDREHVLRLDVGVDDA